MISPKRKRKPNWTQDQLLLLPQLVLEKKNIIKGKFDTGISSKTKREMGEDLFADQCSIPACVADPDDCERRFKILCE